MKEINMQSSLYRVRDKGRLKKSPNTLIRPFGCLNDGVLFNFYNRAVLDASSISLFNYNEEKNNGSFDNVIKVYEKLLNINPSLEIIAIADASLKYKINDLENFEKYRKEGLLYETPAGTEADYFMLKFAQDHPNSVIISNDRFRKYRRLFGELIDRRIPFMIINGEILFYQRV